MDASTDGTRKRKAVTRDRDDEPGIVSGDELDASGSDSEVELVDESSDDDDEEEELASDEIPSDVDRKHLELETNGDFDESDDEPNYRIEKDANGNDRYVYDEINPDDNSDNSDVDESANTIGNIPMSFYDSYPHIGYDINGKKIMRPAKGAALDALLDSIEVPKGFTGLTDPSTGKPLELDQKELELLAKIQRNEIPDEDYNPYEPMVEWFSSKKEVMPLSAAPEPKRRFVPSKHEAKRVMKIVRAIREGRIQPYKPPSEREEEDDTLQRYDIWADEEERPDHPMHMPAPKPPPPGYEESYHPPPEYLPDARERAQWAQTPEEDREREFLPTDYPSLRKVPGYERFVNERFERCLDLYLAPRVRRNKLNIDPESLLPKLPNPEDLKPFPTACATVFRGHKGRVRTLAVDPNGVWLASGGDDGTVRVWELLTGRQLWSVFVGGDSADAVNVVRWRPTRDAAVLAVAAGDNLFIIVPPIVDPETEARSAEAVDAGWGYAASKPAPKPGSTADKKPPIRWTRPAAALADEGVAAVIPLSYVAKSLSWHRRGDYFVTVCPSPSTPASAAVAVHTLSKHQTQHPFRRRIRGGGPAQAAHFHPSKPLLFVATQRAIRAYDLARQALVRIMQPGARWISSFDVHPTSAAAAGGDNLIVGSYDRRLLWHDLELSSRPYKTLRYHARAIRAVRFHARCPLFADASDDGALQVFHGSVSGDMLSNASIVPLKVLRGHRVVNDLGVLDLDWHPREAWCVSAGADGTCRLWV